MPRSAEHAAIETVDLCKLYGDFAALDRLNLAVPRGLIFGLLGPNGAGKTTAIKILTTLLDASSGSATVAGFDVSTEPVEVRRRIGYVPQLLFGKALSAGLRGLVQATVVYLVAIALQVHIRWEPLPMLTVAAAVFVGSCVFSTFSLFIACIVKTRERFMGIGQILTMPLFFASNAIYPIELMPAWLQAIAAFNPLTYLVDALRGAMIVGGTSAQAGIVNFGVMLFVLSVLLALASKLYPGLAR